MSELVILRTRAAIQLVPAAPFNFDATLHKPDHFPSADNMWQPGIRWQTMRWQGRPLGLKFEAQGTQEQPGISLSIWSEEELAPAFVAGLGKEIDFRHRFDLDLSRFHQRFADDPWIGQIVHKWRGMRPCNYLSLYEYLIIAIVLQNATVRRSVAMLQAMYERYGTLLAYDGKELCCFWTPEVMDRATEEELRMLKVGYRAKSIKRVTEAFAHRQIDEYEMRTRSLAEQRQALLRLYGIGPASVGYILGDVFHHLDEMSHISPWEQRIYSKLFFDQEPDDPVSVETLLRFFDDHFAPYRGLAVHYVWEDLFWKWKHESVPWLDKLIRL
jgi:3-methyladenine DNA glycosylase/8-oxoguanine DNA glycosylase